MTHFHILWKPLIFITYFQAGQQIYESHLFLLGRYTYNSGIYVKIKAAYSVTMNIFRKFLFSF